MRKDIDVAVDMLHIKIANIRRLTGFVKIIGTADGLQTYTNIPSALLPKTCGGWPVVVWPVDTL